MLVDVAAAGEFGSGGSPAAWVGASGGDIAGDRAGGEEPNRNGGASPFSCVDTTAGIVESTSERLGVRAHDSATGVGSLAISVHIAVVRVEVTTETGVLDGTSIAGVQGHLVLGLLVDTFEDVDFSVLGPVRA